MVQQLSTFTALVEDPGSVPITHTAGNICLQLQFLCIWCLPLASVGTAHM